jgi:hypothetical protein
MVSIDLGYLDYQIVSSDADTGEITVEIRNPLHALKLSATLVRQGYNFSVDSNVNTQFTEWSFIFHMEALQAIRLSFTTQE